MPRKFLTSIDLTGNEIQNFVIHVLATPPASPTLSRTYFNSTDNRLYLWQGAAWKDITGYLDSIASGTTALVVADNGDGTVTMTIADATQSVAGLMSAADKLKLDSATSTNTADTLVLRDVNGDVILNDIQIASASTSWTANSAVTKSWVENLVTSAIRFKGTIDCSTNPNYPAATNGDAYVAQPGGLIGGASGKPVNQGDWIIANADNSGGDEATVGASWDVIQNQVGDATETVSGKIRIATQTEVDAGTDDTTAVTPLKLATRLAALPPGSAKFAANIGDGTSTSFSITHGLNMTDIHMQLFENATGDLVEADYSVIDANTVSYAFAVAPSTDQYRAVVMG